MTIEQLRQTIEAQHEELAILRLRINNITRQWGTVSDWYLVPQDCQNIDYLIVSKSVPLSLVGPADRLEYQYKALLALAGRPLDEIIEELL